MLNLALFFGGAYFLYYFINKRRQKAILADLPLKPITTIAEEEEKLKQVLKSDFSIHFEYLKTIKNNNDFSEFFKTYEELHHDVELYVENRNKVNLKTFLQNTQGRQFLEEFKDLQRLMSIEKYAPIHDQEHIDELYDRIIKIYSEIVN